MHAEQLFNYNPATSSAGPFPGTFAGGANLRAAEEVDNPAWSKTAWAAAHKINHKIGFPNLATI